MAKGQKTGGRVAGTPNKATATIKTLAGAYSAEAVEILISVARNADSDAAKVAACRELLDRGHGKAKQGVEVTGEEGAPLLPKMDLMEVARRTAFLMSLPELNSPRDTDNPVSASRA